MSNQQKQEKDLTKERDERCVPVAKEVMKLIINYDGLMMGTVDVKEAMKSYKNLVQEVKATLLKNNVKINEISYIFQLAFEPLDTVKNMVIENINHQINDLRNTLFGKEFAEVTYSEMDEKLKTIYPIQEESKEEETNINTDETQTAEETKTE